MPDQRFILIGRILGPHGIAGSLKLMSYAESVDVFAPGRPVLAVDAAGEETVYEIAWARPQGRGALLGLKGVATRSQAEALAGCDLYLEKAALPTLEDGTYYWARELLLPALRSVVKSVDLEARRMQVEVPDGLE